MSKTEVVLAFSQMPEELQSPFKALYPEIVPETPVNIVIDPEARAIDFTVGAREMSFGPSNENYSVFLSGIYRMLFAAAQKSGWMSNYPPKEAQQTPTTADVPAEAAPVAAAPTAPAPSPTVANVKKASTDPAPKGQDELYVRPLDFVNALRDDWQSWSREHGGKDSMHLQGTVDILDGSHTASSESMALAEKAGWSHDGGLWANPKGLKTADDSKLVAQLRKASTPKTAEVHDDSQLMEHKDNPVEDVADSQTKTKVEDETQIAETAGSFKASSTTEVATAKSASSQDFRPESNKTAQVKAAYSAEVSQAVNKFVDAHAGQDLPLAVFKEIPKLFSYLKDAGLLKIQGEYAKVMSRTQAEDLANAHMASGYHDRVWVKPDGSLVTVNGDEEDEIHDDVAVREGLGGSYEAKNAGWVRVGLRHDKAYIQYKSMNNRQLRVIQDYLMKLNPGRITVDGPAYVEYNTQEEMAQFYSIKNVGQLDYDNLRTGSRKKARNCDAKPIETMFASFPVVIDCPAGATVYGTSPDGKDWEQIQAVNYGEIPGTMGADGEPIDVFLGSDSTSPWVFIVNQNKDVNGEMVPDEIKVGLGFNSMDEAKEAYLSMFPEGWTNYDTNLVTASADAFREWAETHSGETNVCADDFRLTTDTPELVEPTPTVAPEAIAGINNQPQLSYVASVKEVHSEHQADVLTSFHDVASRPMDHTAALLANLISTQTLDPTRGHVASTDAYTRSSLTDAVKVSVDTHKANLVPTHTSSSRIAEIIVADLNCGLSPDECEHRASGVNYYGSDQQTFRKTLAKLAGIAGQLVLQPNFIKKSCVATHKALTSTHKASRNKVAYHSVASTESCGGCEHCKCSTSGDKHCALYQKPIVASVEDMHKIADSVWGKSKEAKTALGLSKRALAYLDSYKQAPVKSPIDQHTAAVEMGDAAENRPVPTLASMAPDKNAAAYVTASLSQGLTPSRIAEVVERSVTYSPAFKEAAVAELNKQMGLMGFLTVLPNFVNASCSSTHGKHFSATAADKDRRKTAFHSVLKVSACEGCINCQKSASGPSRCTLYGKPLVASVSDLRTVVAQAFPPLASKVAAASKEEMVQAALPYLAKALGVPEDHPSLKALQVSDKPIEPVVNMEEAKPAKVDGDKDAIEGASKNVMDIAMTAAEPKTKDLEAITTKVKEAALQGKSTQDIYADIKKKFASVDRVELQQIVRKVASETYVQQAQSSSNDDVYTEVTTTDKSFGETIKNLATEQMQAEKVSLSDNTINLNEFAEMPQSNDEFDAIQDYLQ